ncbi:hypothetical protein [Zavarzinia compransoris]|uniref:hypothetical protein n=1 Tax=Zavarzinia compransoris TaxID=1264899 RepID=UPI00105ED071|nr:hypothetical protein [Zavarzinia compransoris]TDP49007.1 hypothetical protein DES42_101368 [Zavarzinia compransoris]
MTWKPVLFPLVILFAGCAPEAPTQCRRVVSTVSVEGEAAPRTTTAVLCRDQDGNWTRLPD